MPLLEKERIMTFVAIVGADDKEVSILLCDDTNVGRSKKQDSLTVSQTEDSTHVKEIMEWVEGIFGSTLLDAFILKKERDEKKARQEAEGSGEG